MPMNNATSKNVRSIPPRRRGRRRAAALVASLMGLAAAISCSADTIDDEISGWEEFRDGAYLEPETGVYVVDGDIAVPDLEALEAYYWNTIADEESEDEFRLSVNLKPNGNRDKWGLTARRDLGYCVNKQQWGNRYQEIVTAMAQAAAHWNRSAKVNIKHDASQDTSCNASNSDVFFDVRPVTGAPYVARAFFPSYARVNRNILISSDVSYPLAPPLDKVTLKGVLRHELGHALGFRHEHIRRGEQNGCIEGGQWETLTGYDTKSVMHYPQCDGDNTGDLRLTRKDIAGARKVYGGARLRRLITQHGSDRCISSATGAQGVAARLANCGPGSTNVVFDYNWADSFNYDVAVRSQGRCLTAVDPTANGILRMRNCDTSTAQRWRPTNVPGAGFRLRSMADPTLCLTVANGNSGTVARLKACAGSGKSSRFTSPLRPF